MKRLSVYSIFATIALLVLAVACQKEPQRDLTTVDSFTKAKPVWAEARHKEKNLILYFREVIKAGWNKDAYIRIAASTVKQFISGILPSAISLTWSQVT